MAYQVPPFHDGKEKWTSYVNRIESYFEGNNIVEDGQKRALLVSALVSRSTAVPSGCTVGEKSSTTRSVCQLVKGFGVTSTVSPGERKVRRLCDEVAEEDARPTPLSVELVGVVRPVRPSVFRDWQLSSLFGKRGDCCHHATRGEQTVRDVVAEVIVRAGVRKRFHFPWTPDEKGAFKKVSSAAGVIGCVDGSVAVIIAPKGDHHKAASYCCKKHYADIVMLVCDVDMGILS
ncbi:hypothetical protein MTO96_027041 [Rhipicephalus appendiculatus]